MCFIKILYGETFFQKENDVEKGCKGKKIYLTNVWGTDGLVDKASDR